MRSLAEWVFELGYKREWYEPISLDFINWYALAYDHPDVHRHFGDKDIPKLAYQAGHSAVNFEPDNPLASGIDAFEEYRAKFSTFMDYLKAGAVVSGVIAGVLFEIEQILFSGIAGSIAALLVTPPAFYSILKHQIESNTELIQKFNGELAVLEPKLWTHRHPRYQVGRYFWNRSLNKPRTISVLVFLAVLRAIRPSLYGRVNVVLRDNITEYIERGVWDVSKEELKHVWAQTVEEEEPQR